jgi:arylsulfatase A-like enzyme
MDNKPNILIFMTDQQRGSTLSNKRCLTPNLDRLRKDGVTFSNAFCPSPHCCPSRASFMTGLYPSMHNVWHNVSVPNAISRGLADGIRCWSEDLADAGYVMDYAGKWHVSAYEDAADRDWCCKHSEKGHTSSTQAWEQYENNAARFNSYAEEPRQAGEIKRPGWAPYTHYGVNENPFNDAGVVDDALATIRERAASGSNEAWCQFIGTLGPHDAYFVPQRFIDMYDINDIELPENFHDTLHDRPNLYQRTREVFAQLSEAEHKQAILNYLAFCTYEDYLFGKVIDELKSSGQLDNTIVIYTSDHGDYLGDHGLWCKGLPCFRGAYEIPLLISWQGHIKNPGRTVDEFISLTDFAPTFLEAAGIECARKFAGKSLLPFLRNEKVNNWRDSVYTQSNGNEQYGIQRSVMTREWKYVYNGFDYDELYDLLNDPGETVNLAKNPEYADKIKELCTKMWCLGRENLDNCLNSYIMIGFAPIGPASAFNKQIPS